MRHSRREFIKTTSALTAGVVLSPRIFAANTGMEVGKNPICVFTKCLQFLEYEKLGETLSNVGFKNCELSVRKGGHVLPENVKTDLPKAVKTLQKYGVGAPMMVSDIVNADHPQTEVVLKTASDLGVKFYRMGYLTYDPSISVLKNLENHKRSFEKLENINRRLNIYGCYQNHSGTRVGGPVWDLYSMVKDCDPQHIGVQYDIRHAFVEGAFAWPIGMKLLAPWIKTTVIKDVYWHNENGKWKISNIPLGKGMIDFDAYLKEYIALKISGPVTIHYEYDLGGAENGAKSTTMGLDKISEYMKGDLNWLKNKFNEHRIAGSFI